MLKLIQLEWRKNNIGKYITSGLATKLIPDIFSKRNRREVYAPEFTRLPSTRIRV